jgi:hypothetical protein
MQKPQREYLQKRNPLRDFVPGSVVKVHPDQGKPPLVIDYYRFVDRIWQTRYPLATLIPKSPSPARESHSLCLPLYEKHIRRARICAVLFLRDLLPPAGGPGAF